VVVSRRMLQGFLVSRRTRAATRCRSATIAKVGAVREVHATPVALDRRERPESDVDADPLRRPTSRPKLVWFDLQRRGSWRCLVEELTTEQQEVAMRSDATTDHDLRIAVRQTST
jgi:hypothetical protein